MAAPATLLLITCAGCTTPPKPIQPSLPVHCGSQQDLKPEQPQAQTLSSCISPPESMPISATSKSLSSSFSPLVTKPLKSAAAISLQQNFPSNRLSRAAPPTLPTLYLRSEGKAVIRLQTQLRQLGYYSGAIDGLYGPVTKASVVKFQQAQQLEPDGITGLRTWTKLSHLPKLHSLPQATVSTIQPQTTSQSSQAASPQAVSSSKRQPKLTVGSLPIESMVFLSLAFVYVGGWRLVLRKTKNTQDFEWVAPAISSSPEVIHPIASVAVHSAKDESKLPAVARSTPKLNSSASQRLAKQMLPKSASPVLDQSAPQTVPQQLLDIVAADGGMVQPLHNLFIGLEGSAAKDRSKQNGSIFSTLNQMNDTGDSSENETIIADLSSEDGRDYTYILVSDAAGLFVLRGNQLRVVNRLLNECKSNSQQITIRRTDPNGISVDQSFELKVQKLRQSAKLQAALVSAY